MAVKAAMALTLGEPCPTGQWSRDILHLLALPGTTTPLPCRSGCYLCSRLFQTGAPCALSIAQVYHNPASLDEDLVQSIAIPAQDPNAAEVFYRIITGSGKPMNRLLDKLDGMPLLLLWGSKVGRQACG